jgi:UDP-galactopyranose mutase
MTFYQVYGVYTPSEAKQAIQDDLVTREKISNLEDYCLSTVGKKIYELFIEGYSEKQWNRHPRDLSASLIKRLPIRFDFNDNYFNDKFQGIPTNGYTAIFDRLLAGIKVDLNTDFIENFEYFYRKYDKVIYTGPVDEMLKYEFGELQYRSLRFEREILKVSDFQGNAVVNYCDKTVPYTRILEHRHFNPELISGSDQNVTVITKEYPEDWRRGGDAFYPLGDESSLIAHKTYLNFVAANYEKLHIGGRLGDYRYYDMHQVIGAALAYCKRSLAK